MLKISDLKVDVAETLGDKFVLTGIRPRKVYNDGKPTSEISGYLYTVVCTKPRITVDVIIDGVQQIDDDVATRCPVVEFDELKIRLYCIKQKFVVSTRASGVHCVNA
jgi:hypothetical protein